MEDSVRCASVLDTCRVQDLVVLWLDYGLPLATVRLLANMDATTSMGSARDIKVIGGDCSYIRLRILSSLTIFAGSLARRLGLINTLVFTYEKEGRRVYEFKFPAFLERCTRARVSIRCRHVHHASEHEASSGLLLPGNATNLSL
mgnify:CR=1 FL=1